MEIGEEERYAAGALFTLALHLTQVEYGAGGVSALESAWGAGDEGEMEEEVRRAEEHREPSQAVWAAYWGYDSCGPGGILDRLFTALRIPQKSWGGLKRLPEVGGISYERRHSYMHLVSNFLQVLDSTLPTAHVISRNYRPDTSASSHAAGARIGGHVGYLPQVDDMLGVHPGSDQGPPSGDGSGGTALQRSALGASEDDPFAASSHALQMKADSVAAGAEQQTQPRGGDIAQLNSHAAKQREAELLLDDSDSDMEADVVFAHVMARHHGTHARLEPDQPADTAHSSLQAKALLEEAQPGSSVALEKHAALDMAKEADSRPSIAENGESGHQEPTLRSHKEPGAAVGVAVGGLHAPSADSGNAGALESNHQASDSVETSFAELSLSAAPSLDRRSSQARGRKPSQKAVGAMWELLESSIAPQLQLDTGADIAKGKKAERVPRVRWYDARVRTALRRVASWLNVPWPAVGNFEHLLAYQVLLPAQPGDPKKQGTAWEQGLWAAKVGATTVGIGALFAVTGGLAAPAIAAGIGAAISLAGGGAAAAAGASGFLATTAGAAAVMSSMGVAGGSYAGAHMARRIGGVKELGFWEVNEFTLQDVHEVAPSQEEMQAAADAKASADAREGLPEDKERAAVSGSSQPGKSPQAPEPDWAASWDDDKPPGDIKDSKAEPPSTFSPRASNILDDFLQSTSTSSAKPEKQHARTGSVVMELREMSSLPREELDLETYAKPEPAETDHGHLDAGHVFFSAMPRPATPPLMVTTAKSGAGEGSGDGAALQGSASNPDTQSQGGKAGNTKESSQHGNKSSEGTALKEQRRFGSGAKHGSSASLDSAASGGSQKRSAAGKDPNKRWLWKPKWKEPPLLLAPISPNGRPDDMRMSLTIGVSGWIGERKDYLKIWSTLEAPDSEVFSLVWESKALLALNSAIGSFMAQQAYQEVAKWAITHFFYTGLVAALATPWILVSFSQMIDHAWAVALNRAQKAGILLAHILMAGAHGDRPVTLIGYSMGARLIFHCLLELCRHSAKGIVEHVVVMGAPVSTRLERWAMARSVVAGRFVNAYSRRDWVLGLIYRGANGFIKGAGGLCPLNCMGIENINLTSIIAGHFDYIAKMEEILELVAIQSSR